MQLLIRADASSQIGTGHIMRCLALAQAWQVEGGKATFLMGMIAPGLENRLEAESCTVIHHEAILGSQEDSDLTIALAQEIKAEAVVVDGYHFDSVYQKQLKQAGLRVLFIDDNGHADRYYADWVLNQNIYAHERLYPDKEPYTQLLLGTRYALLRKEFWPWREWHRETTSHPHKILVTLGGGDPDNVTLKVIQALQQIEVDILEVVVVVGASNPHYGILQEAIQASRHKVELRQNVTNMPELMAWADIAIAASGSTSWELAFMGLPSLTITIADNQKQIAAKLHQLNIVNHVGWFADIRIHLLNEAISHLLVSVERRQSMSDRSRRQVDGWGAKRVMDSLLSN